ncbi:MAG: glycerol-3-phosphate 1-O-acyltransferase PlsY [Ilumatobacteraceae bacterium]
MDAVLAIAVVVVSYFLGTFPSALIVAKRGGIDVTKEGSGNPGTSNVVRLLGWKYGAVVFLADVLKGSASVALAWWVAGDRVTMLGFGCAYAAVIGHTYPVTRKFKGGKGVATGGGSMYVLYPLMSLVLCISWFVLRKATGKSSVASLVITIAVPIYVGFFREETWELAATLGLVAVVILRHLPNIRRLRSNDELAA